MLAKKLSKDVAISCTCINCVSCAIRIGCAKILVSVSLQRYNAAQQFKDSKFMSVNPTASSSHTP